MPHFLDLFLNELHEKREAFRRRLTGEGTTELDGLLKEAFLAEWQDLPATEKQDLRVIAVDSGRAIREYSSGTSMYICRASAITSWGTKTRHVVSNAHIISSPRERLIELVSLRSEQAEHLVALKTIRSSDDVKLLLIDGSLYGRISQVPISFTYPGEEELYLRYMQTFIQLLEECRKRKILILGISKDSVARHLSKLILNKIKIKILKTLEPALDSKELSQLSQYFETDKNEAILIRNLLRSVSISRAQYDLVWDFFHEQLRPRPDFLLINAWADTAGYTTPIEPYPDVPLFKYESKDPEAYVRRRFVNAYNNYENEHDFEKWAVPVMQDTFNLPTFVTFCAKLAHNDTPMRIDLPAFSIGLPTRISEIATSRLLVPPPRRITEVLQILRSEYGGPELYNVFLVRADQEARLPVSDVKTLYEPLVEKELKIPLIPRRRDRRVPHG